MLRQTEKDCVKFHCLFSKVILEITSNTGYSGFQTRHKKQTEQRHMLSCGFNSIFNIVYMT